MPCRGGLAERCMVIRIAAALSPAVNSTTVDNYFSYAVAIAVQNQACDALDHQLPRLLSKYHHALASRDRVEPSKNLLTATPGGQAQGDFDAAE
jgi:hypothetical protein